MTAGPTAVESLPRFSRPPTALLRRAFAHVNDGPHMSNMQLQHQSDLRLLLSPAHRCGAGWRRVSDREGQMPNPHAFQADDGSIQIRAQRAMSWSGSQSDDRHAPIFVVGAGHSGTTLLRAVLSRHPDVWGWALSDAERMRWARDQPAKVLNPVESSLFVRWHADERYLAGALAEWRRRALSDLPTRLAAQRRRSAAAANATLEAPTSPEELAHASARLRVLEKTPSHVCHLRQILETLPRARVVLMVRDGRHVAASLYARMTAAEKDKAEEKNSWASAVGRWVADTRMGLRHAAVDPRVYTLFYEDLIARPADALTAVLTFLGLATSPRRIIFQMLRVPRRAAPQATAVATTAAAQRQKMASGSSDFISGRQLGQRLQQWHDQQRHLRRHIQKRLAQTSVGVGQHAASAHRVGGSFNVSAGEMLLAALGYVEPPAHAVWSRVGVRPLVFPVRTSPRQAMPVIRHGVIMEQRRLELDAPHMAAEDHGRPSFTGASVIARPRWLPRHPGIGRFMLYFGHHNGRAIRLATSDGIGPSKRKWHVHPVGVLRVEQTACRKHVSSPDVIADHLRRRIVLYFHACRCPADGDAGRNRRRPNDAWGDAWRPWDASKLANQRSYVVESRDGLNFSAVVPSTCMHTPYFSELLRPAAMGTMSSGGSTDIEAPIGTEAIGGPYLRVFSWRGACYALGMPGLLHRSTDPCCLRPFELGPQLLPNATRHIAIRLQPATSVLEVFYSRVGDTPERLVHQMISLKHRDWRQWRAFGAAVDLLAPMEEYEGGKLSLDASVPGQAKAPVRELRDPFVFTAPNGKSWLFYSVAGEQGIAIAGLKDRSTGHSSTMREGEDNHSSSSYRF